jgi:hypothetical protein
MEIRQAGLKIYDQISHQVKSRAYQASNELRNAELVVLRGQRSGRRYRVPFTRGDYIKNQKAGHRGANARYYTASAPGEPPAVRTGALRSSFVPQPRAIVESNRVTQVYPGIYSNQKYARYLEEGTQRMEPRPYAEAVKTRAWKGIKRIYSEPYTL